MSGEGHSRHLNEPAADKVSYIARRWFNTIIEAHKELVVLLLKENIVNISTPILLSGGCFQNRILSNGLKYAPRGYWLSDFPPLCCAL